MFLASPITFPNLGITVDPNPVAFTVFGKSIYWYGIIIAAGFLLAVLYMMHRAKDFGITQDKPPTKAMQEKQNRKSEAQRLRENEKLCFSALVEYYKLLQEWMVVYAPRTPEDTPNDRFVQVCHHLSYVEYLVDLLIMGDSYERTEVIDMMMTDGKLKKLQIYLENVKKEDKAFERRKESAR